MVTQTPRLFNTRPIDAAATPLPTLETTPPVQKMYFGMFTLHINKKFGGEGHF
jgi:hypothetical protein